MANPDAGYPEIFDATCDIFQIVQDSSSGEIMENPAVSTRMSSAITALREQGLGILDVQDLLGQAAGDYRRMQLDKERGTEAL